MLKLKAASSTEDGDASAASNVILPAEIMSYPLNLGVHFSRVIQQEFSRLTNAEYPIIDLSADGVLFNFPLPDTINVELFV